MSATGKERLLSAGLSKPITLPTGVRIKGAMPSMLNLIRRRMIPDDLMVTLVQAQAAEKDGKSLSEAEFDARIRNQHIEAAAFVRQVENEDGTWETVTLTEDDVRAMDHSDIDALISIVTSTATPTQVDADSRRALGLISKEEWTAIAEQEAAATVIGWREFRDNTPSPDAGSHGGEVRPPAERPDGPPKKPARSRARSGARLASG